MIIPELSILNQKGTPMFNSDVFANRPPFGIVGRIFISTDTKELYRDTGTSWELLAGPGSGTITGSGTAGTLPIFTGSSTISNSSLLEGATKFTTTKSFQAQSIFLNDMTAGSGALYYNVAANRLTLANYNVGGNVYIEVGGGSYAQIISGADNSTTFYGNIIRNGGLSTQFLKADGSLDNTAYQPLLTNPVTGTGTATQVAFWSGSSAISSDSALYWDNTNKRLGIGTATPGVTLDVHGSNVIQQLNGTGTTNARLAFQNAGTNKWVIGNIHSGGDNYLQIFDTASSLERVKLENTGTLTLSGSQKIDGANGLSGGFLGFKQFASTTSSDVGYTGISALSTDILSLAFYQSGSGGGTIYRTIRFSAASIANSATRTFTFPNASGTLALTADLSAYLPLTGGTLTGNLTLNQRLLFSGTKVANINSDGSIIYIGENGVSNILNVDLINQRVGINVVNPLVPLHVETTGTSTSVFGNVVTTLRSQASGRAITLQFSDGTTPSYISSLSGDLVFGYGAGSGTESARFKTTGNFLIGKTSDNGDKLQVQGAVMSFGSNAQIGFQDRTIGNFFLWYSPSGTPYFYNSSVGNIASINASTGAYTALSDVNKKKDIEDSNLGVDTIMKLRPRLFRMKYSSDKSVKELGFIAQEVKEFIPEAYFESEGFIGLQDRPIIAVLVKAIQELNNKIDQIKN